MNKTVSLKEDREFKRLYKRGGFVAGDCLVLYYNSNKRQLNRLGITVSKKIGKAVLRNRIRRLIKENYRLKEESVKSGVDLVFVARSKAAGADFHKISSCMDFLLQKAGLRS